MVKNRAKNDAPPGFLALLSASLKKTPPSYGGYMVRYTLYGTFFTWKMVQPPYVAVLKENNLNLRLKLIGMRTNINKAIFGT